MPEKIIYQEWSADITAGQFAEMHIPAQYIAVLDSTASGDDLKIGFIDQDQSLTPIRAGIGFFIPDLKKSRIRLKNDGSNTITVKIAVSDTQISDNRVVFESAIPVTGGSSHSTPVQVTVSTSPIQIIAANTSRTNILIQNNSVTDVIWLGDSNTTIPRGIRLDAGSTLSSSSKGAFHAISSGTAGLVNIFEETL